MAFQKGYIPWNKGKRLPLFSEEHRRKISEALTGRKRPPFSEEWKRNNSESNKGRQFSEESRKKISEALRGNKNCLGRKLSEETRRKQSEAHKGENHYNWKGGRVPYYGPDWHQQRRLVRERDDYTCLCGARENGREHDVHHIVPYRISKDNSQDNLWTLCSRCHRRMETILEVITFAS